MRHRARAHGPVRDGVESSVLVHLHGSLPKVDWHEDDAKGSRSRRREDSLDTNVQIFGRFQIVDECKNTKPTQRSLKEGRHDASVKAWNPTVRIQCPERHRKRCTVPILVVDLVNMERRGKVVMTEGWA